VEVSNDKTIRRYLYDAVKKIDLSSFIEVETGCSWDKTGASFSCICPMPSHRDSKPSFSVEEQGDGVWLYNCFGCSSGGTIIDFCMEYFALNHSFEALLLVVEKSGLATDGDLISKAIKEAKVTIDTNKRLECRHFVAASNCRRLLFGNKGDPEIEGWVATAYRRMNKMLEEEDLDGIEMIGNDALVKLTGVVI
jgi:hypothetical protein